MSPTGIWFERAAIGVASLVLSVGLIIVLSGYFAGRDQAGLSGSTGSPAPPPPGQAIADQGHAILRPGQPHPAYDSNPPTSGPHRPIPIRRQGRRLSDDQLLQALEVGDIVLLYGNRRAPGQLRVLTRRLASPFSPGLAASGRAIILGRRPGTHGVIALAWDHLLRVRTPGDPTLRRFIAYWLGRGASGRCC